MSKIFIKGDRIYLKELTEKDVTSRYVNWLNDQTINRYLESRFEKWNIAKLKKYVRNISCNPQYLFLAIITNNHKHIGNIKIGPINNIHKFTDIGILIGDKDEWNKGYATEALKLTISFIFSKLKLNKIIAGVYAANSASINIFKKCGFSVESVKKAQYIFQDRYTDSIVLSLFNREYGKRQQ